MLSIGTGHSVNLYRQSHRWGLLTGWGREKLVGYVMSLQSQSSRNIAELLLGDRYLEAGPGDRKTGAWTIQITSTI